MGLFNYLDVALTCPRCRQTGLMESDMRIGYKDLSRYRLGDRMVWANRSCSKYHQMEPKEKVYVGEGYVECPFCHKDFWIAITFEDSVITKAEVDPHKAGYIP